LALQRAESARVRQYAEEVLQTQAVMGRKLRDVADKSRLTLAATPTGSVLPSEHQALRDLPKAQGGELDREFLQLVAATSASAIPELETAFNETQNGYVRDLAYDAIGKLEYQRQKAERLLAR
jgi:predicted outer membrane protein